jgi:hypothetical protein
VNVNYYKKGLLRPIFQTVGKMFEAEKLSHGSIVFVSAKVGFGKTFAQMAKFGSIWQLGRPGTDTMILKIFFAKKCEK